MGTMTGNNFITDLRIALDQRADTSASDANLLRWINHAYWHMTYPSIHAFENFKTTEDITLATDDADYDLSGLGYRILALYSVHHLESAAPTYTTQRAPLKPRNIRWYDGHSHSSGPPRFFVAGEGEQILVSPVPSSNENGHILRLRLWREATALLVGTTTEVPSYFDEVLLLGSQAVAEYRLGYRDRARETLEHYAAMLNDPRQKDDIEGEDWGFEAQLISEPVMGAIS